VRFPRYIALLAIALTGCSPAVSQTLSPRTSAPSPTASPTENSGSRRTLELRLTLTSVEDLKIRQGDKVKEGQVLSDRIRDRARLQAQKRGLEIQIDRLKQPVAAPPPSRQIPDLAALPPATFLDETAEVEAAKLKVQVAQSKVTAQERKIALLDSLPDSQVPEAVPAHEAEVLRQLQDEVNQAIAAQQLAEGKLNQAQQDRQYQEYQHSVEQNKRAIAIQQAELQRQQQLQNQQEQEQNRAYQLAQVEAQLQNVEGQISQLSAVRCPFPGTIRKVKYENQTDQNLIAVLSLIAEMPDRSK
jgi:hypothetical protein